LVKVGLSFFFSPFWGFLTVSFGTQKFMTVPGSISTMLGCTPAIFIRPCNNGFCAATRFTIFLCSCLLSFCFKLEQWMTTEEGYKLPRKDGLVLGCYQLSLKWWWCLTENPTGRAYLENNINFWIAFIGQGEQGRWAKAPCCEVLWLTKLPLLMQISCTKPVFYNSKFSVFNLKLFDFDHLHCLLPPHVSDLSPLASHQRWRMQTRSQEQLVDFLFFF